MSEESVNSQEGAKGEICFFQEFFFVFVCVDR